MFTMAEILEKRGAHTHVHASVGGCIRSGGAAALSTTKVGQNRTKL
jgi:hypothetical protein